MSDAITLCRYWVKPGRETEFEALLEKHWPTFQGLGLVSDAVPHLLFRGRDDDGNVFYVETFPWKDTASMNKAHGMAEVAALWEPMGDCCTKMEFPTVDRL